MGVKLLRVKPGPLQLQTSEMGGKSSISRPCALSCNDHQSRRSNTLALYSRIPTLVLLSLLIHTHICHRFHHTYISVFLLLNMLMSPAPTMDPYTHIASAASPKLLPQF